MDPGMTMECNIDWVEEGVRHV
jgi:hypothetical protein